MAPSACSFTTWNLWLAQFTGETVQKDAALRMSASGNDIAQAHLAPRLVVCSLCAQSCPTLCNSVACSLPGFTIHGIVLVRTLEWVTISSCRESFQPRDQIHVSCVSCIDRQILYHLTTWEALLNPKIGNIHMAT